MTLDSTSQFIFIGALLALTSVVASLLSRRFGAPILLVFLVLGMLAGEDGPGGIVFNNFNTAFLFGSLALAVIILDGGLGARKETFRVSLTPALSLATVAVLITAAVTGLAVYWIFDLSLLEAFLIGAIVGSTDAAAVFGLLRFARLELRERTSATLEIESGTNDPMAIFLTVALVQLLSVSGANPGLALLLEFIQQMGFGLVAGAAGGFGLAALVRVLPLPASLYPLFVLAGGLTVFGAANYAGGSGFLAIYLVGVIVGNTPLPYSSDIHRFHDGVAWLSQIGMFLMLGLLITPSHLPPIILPAVAIALVLIFVARPLAVAVSLLPFHFPWREQAFISWCGLRGAVPIILALFPSLAGLENTHFFFELVFFVVLLSLLLQGWTIAPVARWLRVELPPKLGDPEHKTLLVNAEQSKMLHVYHVVEECEAMDMRCTQLPMEEGAQLVGVVRLGVLLEVEPELTLRNKDQVMILGPEAVPSLGRLFTPSTRKARVQSFNFFGEFAIAPDARLDALAEIYGFDVPQQYATDTVAHYIGNKFHTKPVVGDSVTLGNVLFVVKEITHHEITSVGLKLITTAQ